MTHPAEELEFTDGKPPPETPPEHPAVIPAMVRLSTMQRSDPDVSASLKLKNKDGTMSSKDVMLLSEAADQAEVGWKWMKKRAAILIALTLVLTCIGLAIASAFLGTYVTSALGVDGEFLIRKRTSTLIRTARVNVRTPISRLPSLYADKREWLSSIRAVNFSTEDGAVHYFKVWQYEILDQRVTFESSFGNALLVSPQQVLLRNGSGSTIPVTAGSTQIISAAYYPYENYCGNADKNDCSDNADCNNDPTVTKGYVCTCRKGYTGNGAQCNGIDKCAANPCSPLATCANNEDPAKDPNCKCDPGYSGNGLVCGDVNECGDAQLNNCNSVNGTCTNAQGSFKCDCKQGFTGDGVTCTQVPPPSGPP